MRVALDAGLIAKIRGNEMSWAVGYNNDLRRDIGYGVPSYCDHPGCYAKIDRGLSHICGDLHYEEDGCGLVFCASHLFMNDSGKFQCERCCAGKPPFKPSLDTDEWIEHKMTHQSWAEWREENGIAKGGAN